MKHERISVNWLLPAGLVAANLAAWGWAWAAFHERPALLGAALLAWGLGLRHALDADHIAAIDGAARSLMAQGQRPVAVGLFFALGHSSVVLLATLAVAVAAGGAAGLLETVGEVGGVVGAVTSVVFLLAMAAANGVTLVRLWRSWRRARDGADLPDETPPRRLPSLVRRSWHLMPLGFLFGLGFDTASAVTLLALSATQMADAVPVWMVLVLPVLFAAGMALVDTVDGIVMVRAIGWALESPRRRLGYNLVLTGLTVVIAALVAAFQMWNLVGDTGSLGLEAGRWDGLVDEHFDVIGAGIVAVFLLLWGGAALRARLRD